MYQSLSRMRNAVEGGSGEQPSWGSPSYRFGFSVLSRAQLPPFSSPRLTHRLAHPCLPDILIITPDSPLSALPLLHTVRVGGLLLMLVSVAACVGSMVDALCADRTEDRGAFTLVSKSRGMNRSPFRELYPLDSGIF